MPPSPFPTQAQQQPLPTQLMALSSPPSPRSPASPSPTPPHSHSPKSSAELAIEAAEEQVLAAIGDLCAPFERSNRHMQNALAFAAVMLVGQILVLVASYGNYSAWAFEKKIAEQIDAARLWKSRALSAAKAGKPSQRI